MTVMDTFTEGSVPLDGKMWFWNIYERVVKPLKTARCSRLVTGLHGDK